MEKSIAILCEEFKNNFAKVISESYLPACVIEPIIESYLKDIKMISKRQYEMDLKSFLEANKEDK